MCYHASSTDDRTLANGYATTNCRISTDPYIFFQRNWSGRTDSVTALFWINCMTRTSQTYARSNKCPRTNVYRRSIQNYTIIIDNNQTMLLTIPGKSVNRKIRFIIQPVDVFNMFICRVCTFKQCTYPICVGFPDCII